MGRLLHPNLYIESIFLIDFANLKKKGILGIIFDIDNTLVPHNFPNPDEKLKKLFEEINNLGFKVCFVSNNNKKRVESFCKNLNSPYIYGAGKPLKRPYKKAMSILNTDKESTAIIGDQIFSDILGGNRVGIYTILVKPISKGNEGIFVFMKRKLEERLLKNIKMEE